MSPPCNPTNDLNLEITTSGGYDAVRSDPGNATAPIDAWATNPSPPPQPIEYCRYVNNSGAQSIFVPFKSKEEWTAFLNHLPSLVSVQHCSRKHTFTIYPSQDGSCTNASPASIDVTFPYQPYDQVNHKGVTLTISPDQQFTCNPGPNQWIQTALVQSTGLDSDSNDPSWTDPPTVTYSGGPSDLCARPPDFVYHIQWGGGGCSGPQRYYPTLCVSGALASTVTQPYRGDVVHEYDWSCSENGQISQCVYWCETTCGNYRC